MARDATLHVKLDREMNDQLRQLASRRRRSKGQLVREAITACYQTTFDSLPVRQKQAVAAYQGGFISIGKLAKEMGLPLLDLRHWLTDHDIAQNNVYGSADADHA